MAALRLGRRELRRHRGRDRRRPTRSPAPTSATTAARRRDRHERRRPTARPSTATGDVVAPAPPVTPCRRRSPAPPSDGQTLTRPTTARGPARDPITYTYQWQRCDAGGSNCSDIAGETGSSYTLVRADVGQTMRVVVTAHQRRRRRQRRRRAPTAVVAPAPPVNTVRRRSRHRAGRSDADAPTTASWTGTARSPTPTSGSAVTPTARTARTSRARPTPRYNALRRRRRPCAARRRHRHERRAARDSATSAATAVDRRRAAGEHGAPGDLGHRARRPDAVGRRRHVDRHRRSPTPTSGSAATPTARTARTSPARRTPTLHLSGADVGHALRVVVTGTNAAGYATRRPRDPTGEISAAPPDGTAPPAISGTPTEGETLTASDGTWDGTRSVTFTYQWQRCDADGSNCVDIAGATNATYDAAAADVGHVAARRRDGDQRRRQRLADERLGRPVQPKPPRLALAAGRQRYAEGRLDADGDARHLDQQRAARPTTTSGSAATPTARTASTSRAPTARATPPSPLTRATCSRSASRRPTTVARRTPRRPEPLRSRPRTRRAGPAARGPGTGRARPDQPTTSSAIRRTSPGRQLRDADRRRRLPAASRFRAPAACASACASRCGLPHGARHGDGRGSQPAQRRLHARRAGAQGLRHASRTRSSCGPRRSRRERTSSSRRSRRARARS